jgi:hypothetical protein
MIRKTLLTAFIGTIIILGIAGSAMATPDGSQRLRGMEGRVFFVSVEVVSSILGDDLPVGTVFPNCYFFDADGVWFDPGFPALGSWTQDSNGAKTSYTASANDGGGLQLDQVGTVTPGHGNGVLQFEAFSTLLIPGLVLAEFVSVGAEVDECPL